MHLTRRQKEILDFIREYLEREGYAPSLEEIGARFGLSSVATVHKHVQNLVEKGMLRKAWNRSRSLELVDPREPAALEIPLLGTVAAGAPIEAVPTPDSIAVPASLVASTFRTDVLGSVINLVPRRLANLGTRALSRLLPKKSSMGNEPTMY